MWISILPMTENYPEIWDYLETPDFINKEYLIDKITFECAELELLYSDPVLLKYMIRNWSATEQHIWTKLADTMDLEYNPIFNLDVTWEETRKPDLTKTRTPNITEDHAPNITTERTPDLKTVNKPEDVTTSAVQGYNESTWADSSKITRGGSITENETGSERTTTSGSDRTITSGVETETETGTDTITTRRYGNQGVTMTQDMIEKEREVVQFNLYDYIVKSFKNKFCLLVY